MCRKSTLKHYPVFGVHYKRSRQLFNKDSNINLIDTVNNAYSKLVQERQGWCSKYDISTLTAKVLSDYALLSKIELKDKKVLNIGCFQPVDEVFFIDIVNEWTALDINKKVIALSENLALEALSDKSFSKLTFVVGDATGLTFDDNYFDIVTSFSTIDHIPCSESRKKAISEMCRVVKKGGYIVVTIPNKWDIYYSYMSNKLQKSDQAVFGYEYQFSPIELRKMLVSNGLRIIDCASTNFNPHSYFDKLLRKFGVHKVKIYFGSRFGFLAQK